MSTVVGAIHGMRVIEEAKLSWLGFSHIVGYDEGDEGGTGESESGAEGGENVDGGEGESDDDESKLPDNIKAILKKERDLRAAAEKKAKILERNAQAATKGQGSDKGKGKSGSTQGQSQGEEEGESGETTDPRYEKMVVKFREQSLASTVAAIAKNFADPSDVWRFLDAGLFDYTQDDDDPSNVVWDESEIRTAVKALAKEKPYLLKPVEGNQGGQQGTGTRQSGPKFAGRGSGKQTGGLSVTEMAGRVPALRTAVRTGDKTK